MGMGTSLEGCRDLSWNQRAGCATGTWHMERSRTRAETWKLLFSSSWHLVRNSHPSLRDTSCHSSTTISLTEVLVSQLHIPRTESHWPGLVRVHLWSERSPVSVNMASFIKGQRKTRQYKSGTSWMSKGSNGQRAQHG